MSTQVNVDRPWRVAVLAGMASYLDAATLVTAGLAIGTLYADAFDLSGGTVGALLGTQTLMFAVGALVGGRLGDALGRRRVFTVSLALLAAGATVLATATGTAMLWAGVVVTGFAIGADLPVSLALINEEAPEGKKGKMVAFSELLWGAGILVANVLWVVLSSRGTIGARLVFAHLVVVAVVVLALRLSLRESVEWAAARRAADRPAGQSGRVRFGEARQLLRAPLLATVAATGLYYAAWGVGANTIGQFGSYLWVNLADGQSSTWAIVSAVGIPLAGIGGVLFLRVVDTPRRRRWLVAGTVLSLLAWLIPLVGVPIGIALICTSLLFVLGAAMSGETIYKVWSQELFPTLLRGTAQGVTLAVNRTAAGLFAFVVPVLAVSSPRLLFGIVLLLMVGGAVIALVWVPRLPTARELEEPPVVVGVEAAAT